MSRRTSHPSTESADRYTITHHGVGTQSKAAVYHTTIPPVLKGGFAHIVVRGEELFLGGSITIRRESGPAMSHPHSNS